MQERVRRKFKMVGNLNLRGKNKIKKSEKIAETRMAVYIYIYIVYCHLENKDLKLQNARYNCQKYNYISNFKKINIKNKDRTILNYKEIRI